MLLALRTSAKRASLLWTGVFGFIAAFASAIAFAEAFASGVGAGCGVGTFPIAITGRAGGLAAVAVAACSVAWS